MQKPLVCPGMAWWRPPAGEKAWAAAPASTAAAAATVAPHTSVAASCMPGKGGLSPALRPPGAQRVLRPEVVGAERLVPYHCHRTGHDVTAMSRRLASLDLTAHSTGAFAVSVPSSGAADTLFPGDVDSGPR